MAKLVVSILSSLDGYCAGPRGQLDAMPMGAAFDRHNLELMRSADAMLFGAVTYPMFEAYWPNVDRGEGSDPVHCEIAERFGAARRLVVSDSMKVAPASLWRDTEVVRRSRARARIGELKAQSGGRSGEGLLLFGSHVLVNDLLNDGLVDELHLLIGNVVLGNGVRTFEADMKASLNLLGLRRLPDSDIVALHYDCRRA